MGCVRVSLVDKVVVSCWVVVVQLVGCKFVDSVFGFPGLAFVCLGVSALGVRYRRFGDMLVQSLGL